MWKIAGLENAGLEYDGPEIVLSVTTVILEASSDQSTALKQNNTTTVGRAVA